jgi:DDE superfamily endonuclease
VRPDVLAQGLLEGWEFVCLDGTLIPTVRSARKSEFGHDLWYSGKHHRHGGNVQVLTGPNGYAEWVSAAVSSTNQRSPERAEPVGRRR